MSWEDNSFWCSETQEVLGKIHKDLCKGMIPHKIVYKDDMGTEYEYSLQHPKYTYDDEEF